MSPRTKSQFEELREQSRQQIKQAALELFAKSSYANTSMAQVAKEAGVSKGLIYNYFDSKQDLLFALVEEQVAEGEALMEQFLETISDPLEQLIALTKATVQMVLQDINYWRFMTSLAFQPDVLSELMPLVKRQKETSIRLMIGIFERLGADEPEKETYLYGSMLDGILLQYMTLRADYELEAMQDYLLKRYTEKQYPTK